MRCTKPCSARKSRARYAVGGLGLLMSLPISSRTSYAVIGFCALCTILKARSRGWVRRKLCVSQYASKVLSDVAVIIRHYSDKRRAWLSILPYAPPSVVGGRRIKEPVFSWSCFQRILLIQKGINIHRSLLLSDHLYE